MSFLTVCVKTQCCNTNFCRQSALISGITRAVLENEVIESLQTIIELLSQHTHFIPVEMVAFRHLVHVVFFIVVYIRFLTESILACLSFRLSVFVNS